MYNQKLKEITEILQEEYREKLSDKTIKAFAAELYYSLFVGQYDLEDIPSIVFEYETDAGIEVSQWDYILSCMIDLLDNNEATANRLYNSFMREYDLLNTFLKLYNENSDYIDAQRLAEAKEKALGLFDKEILALYGIKKD